MRTGGLVLLCALAMACGGGGSSKNPRDAGLDGGATGGLRDAAPGEPDGGATGGLRDSAPGEPDGDPYLKLPNVKANNGVASVGPAGAHIVISSSLVLDVPRGAVRSEVDISVRSGAEPSSLFEGLKPDSGPVLEFQPNGLQFEIPVRVAVPRLRDSQGETVGLDSTLVLVASDVYSELVSVRVDEQDNETLRFFMWHFTQTRVTALPPPESTVGSISARTTEFTAGLSREIFDKLLALSPHIAPGSTKPLLQRFEDTHVNWERPALAPYMQPAVAEGLGAGLRSVLTPDSMLINSGWRSVADQYVLSRNPSGNRTAAPFDSHHLSGCAIDLQPRVGKAGCLAAAMRGAEGALAALHPTWGTALTRKSAGFKWYGTGKTSAAEICGDLPHFTGNQAGVRDLRAASIRAFQDLWNEWNPCDPIPEAELVPLASLANEAAVQKIPVSTASYPETVNRLFKSPSGGFAAASQGATKPGASSCVVTDPATGLTWQRVLPSKYAGCALGLLCTPSEALSYCASINLPGGPWRLPSESELLSIVDDRFQPMLNPKMFPVPESVRWVMISSTVRTTDNGSYPRSVSFDKDLLGGHAADVLGPGTCGVRCVR